MSNKLISSKYPFLPLTIHVRVTHRKQIDLHTQALIDTGFSGDIVVPATEELKKYQPDAYATWTMADGSEVMAPIFLDLRQQADENERSDHGRFQRCLANARNVRPHHRELIRKEFLNDWPTRQKRALILRADAERISETLFDHSHTISQKIVQFAWEANARVVQTAHFRPPATGGP